MVWFCTIVYIDANIRETGRGLYVNFVLFCDFSGSLKLVKAFKISTSERA
jgi:hypothetical protein